MCHGVYAVALDSKAALVMNLQRHNLSCLLRSNGNFLLQVGI